MPSKLVLYGYWRSSASFRIRIALNLKGLPYEQHPVHLLREGGEQHGVAYRSINPMGMVPSLKHGERVLTQSMAILEYIEENWSLPSLLPAEPRDRARVRALAHAIASDTAPLGNLRVMNHLRSQFQASEAQCRQWQQYWMGRTFEALETMLGDHPATGVFCHDDQPGLADLCLVPQLYNAARWGVALEAYPTLRRISEACLALDAFQRALPEAQPDAPASAPA